MFLRDNDPGDRDYYIPRSWDRTVIHPMCITPVIAVAHIT